MLITQADDYYYSNHIDPYAGGYASPIPPHFVGESIASSSSRLSLPPTDYELASRSATSPISQISSTAVPVKRKRGRPPKNPAAHANGGSTPKPRPSAAAKPSKANGVIREPVCGFCGQGDNGGPNGVKEDLVSCVMCGRSGHPICLGFKSPEIIKKIKSYAWCCMECKPCEQCRLQGDDVSWDKTSGTS